MIKIIKNNRQLIYTIVPFLSLIIIIISKIIVGGELFIDKLAYDIVVEQFRSPAMTIFMKNITKLCDTSYIIIIATILTLLFIFKWKQKSIAKLIPCSLISATLMSQALKVIIKRERPFGYRLIQISGYSFPSGHAMVSMAFYGLLIYIIYRLVKNKTLRNICIIINVLIILLVGISRVYLGVHYLSDIIAGYAISIIYLLLLVKFIKKRKIIP